MNAVCSERVISMAGLNEQEVCTLAQEPSLGAHGQYLHSCIRICQGLWLPGNLPVMLLVVFLVGGWDWLMVVVIAVVLNPMGFAIQLK